MRAKFVLVIRAASASAFPSNESLVDRLLMLGLGAPESNTEPYDIRRKMYQDDAQRDWSALPEVAEAEREQVIFFSRLPDHGRLVVTRVSQGTATIRFIHDSLARLEKNSEAMIRELGKRTGSIDALDVQDGRVEIYERGQNHVIIVGRVISNALRETVRRNPADIISAVVTGAAAIVTLAIMAFAHLKQGAITTGTVERFSTAMISAFFIAVVNFVQHWARLNREGIIEWRPASEEA
jgi:hypothetical protein